MAARSASSLPIGTAPARRLDAWPGPLVLVDDPRHPLECVAFPLTAGRGAERVVDEHGELCRLAAQLDDVLVGAGDVLTAWLAVGEVGGAAGVVAAGLQAAFGLG